MLSLIKFLRNDALTMRSKSLRLTKFPKNDDFTTMKILFFVDKVFAKGRLHGQENAAVRFDKVSAKRRLHDQEKPLSGAIDILQNDG